MDNKKQTAVEWLWGQIKPRCDFDNVPDNILEQAKELEKYQHEETALHMLEYVAEFFVSKKDIDCQNEFNKYYNETYGGNNGKV